jgi:hypothetical protein
MAGIVEGTYCAETNCDNFITLANNGYLKLIAVETVHKIIPVSHYLTRLVFANGDDSTLVVFIRTNTAEEMDDTADYFPGHKYKVKFFDENSTQGIGIEIDNNFYPKGIITIFS